MNALAITSITNFILAGEVLFLAGMLVRMPKIQYSAAWFWAGAMTLLGVAALIGGIDHGFFEQSGLPRYFIQRSNWIVLGAMTFCILMTTARQFFSPSALEGFHLIRRAAHDDLCLAQAFTACGKNAKAFPRSGMCWQDQQGICRLILIMICLLRL